MIIETRVIIRERDFNDSRIEVELADEYVDQKKVRAVTKELSSNAAHRALAAYEARVEQ